MSLPEWRLAELREAKIYYLVDFCNQLGRLPDSSLRSDPGIRNMYSFMSNLRSRYGKGELTEKDIQALSTHQELYDYVMGDPDQWNRHLAKLEEYLFVKRRFPISKYKNNDEYNIYQFVHNTLSSYRKGELSQERIDKLNALTPVILNHTAGQLILDINKWILAGSLRGKGIDEEHFRNDKNSFLCKGLTNKQIKLLVDSSIYSVKELADKILEASIRFKTDMAYNSQCRNVGYLLLGERTLATNDLSYSLGIDVINKTTKVLFTDELTKSIFSFYDSTCKQNELVAIQEITRSLLPRILTDKSFELKGISNRLRYLIENMVSTDPVVSETLQYRFFENLTYFEIAKRMNTSVECARQRVKKGCRNLRYTKYLYTSKVEN